jgi:hypothetical protein
MKKILLLASIAFSMATMAQAPATRINFTKGQKIEVTTESKKNSTMDFMGQSIENIANSTVTEIYQIEDVDASGTMMEYKIKRLVVDINAMGRSENFDSDKESDRKSEVGKMMGKGLKDVFNVQVDASGNIVSVKKNGAVQAAKKQSDEEAMEAMMAAQLGLQFGAPKQGDPIMFKILPEKTVASGDTWSTESNSNGTKKKTVYLVNSIDEKDIVLSYLEELTINSKQQIMGTEASISGTGKSSGKITIDRASGIMKNKTVTSNASTSLEAQGMTIPTTEKSTVTVSVKTS